MRQWKDYYEILGVRPEASEEEIKKARDEEALICHPDRMAKLSESVRQRAQEKMKEVNEAYAVLGDPEKRKKYHSEWLHKKGATTVPSGTYRVPKPKPVVDPPHILLDNIPAKTVKVSSFIIRNEGGPYSEIWFSDPKSWVKVIKFTSLSDSDQLPLRVEIAVEGEDWGKTYLEIITVRLDNEETQVRIELRTQAEPAGKTTYAGAGSGPRGYVGRAGTVYQTSAPAAPAQTVYRPSGRPKTRWYFTTSALVIALLVLGPLALPLVWFNPRYKIVTKFVVTGLVTALSVGLCYFTTNMHLRLMKQIGEQRIQESRLVGKYVEQSDVGSQEDAQRSFLNSEQYAKRGKGTAPQLSGQVPAENKEKITIDSLTRNIPDTDYFVAQSKIFDASFDIVWNAANEYLKKDYVIDISDRNKGILTTKQMIESRGGSPKHAYRTFVLIEKISEDSTKVTVKRFYLNYFQKDWFKPWGRSFGEIDLEGIEKEIKKEIKQQEKQGYSAGVGGKTI